MDSTKGKPPSKRSSDVFLRGSSVLSFISILLIVALFLRMETINKRTEMNELRILAVESRMRMTNKADENVENEPKMFTDFDGVTRKHPVDHYKRKKRNNALSPTAGTITLQQVRQEINNKFNEVCKPPHSICQAGPPGPPGALGYPGYKGEKGAPGKEGPPGPSGPIGAPGMGGKRGPVGPQGVKGNKGDKGSVGATGIKGETGSKGHQGQKGSIGFKGNRGSRGLVGIQGPKGECVVPPKISVYPVSQQVFMNEPAIVYCWVQGQASSKITWLKLGGVLSDATVTVKNGTLRISRVQRSHVGSYMCTAHTGLGMLRTISRLQIKEPPKFTNKPSSQVILEYGTTASLCCEATGSPPLKIQWYRAQKNSVPIPAYHDQEDGCLLVNTTKENAEGDYICRATNSLGLAETTIKATRSTSVSCDLIQRGQLGKSDGIYNIDTDFRVYCDMTTDGKGWTLIARFSNSDAKNWMADTGYWWYDQRNATGKTDNPFTNADMISPAFWIVSGNEMKITRSDDYSHTPLLQTTGSCLGGQTFRSKITSYGNFRNGKAWASNQCLGSCTIQYGGQYKSTDGFQQAECSGNIQSANKIGFWCHWSNGDGSVMMIGGGGSSCARADHGIGITERNAASFDDPSGGETEYDFGYDAGRKNAPSQSYSLNIWIR